MKLSVTGIEFTVNRLYKSYSNEQKDLRLISERIIYDFEELIELSKVCEFVVYRTLHERISQLYMRYKHRQMEMRRNPKPRAKIFVNELFKLEGSEGEELEDLHIELRDIVKEIRSELSSEDFKNIDDNLVIIDGPSDQNSHVFVCT